MRTFELENPKTGERFDILCEPKELRRRIPRGWQVAEVPSRISVCPKGEPIARDETLRGFKQVEEKIGTSALLRGMGMGMTADQVKKVWAKRPDEKR